ncbi:MAG: S-layer homology domain-containing protein [Oscillospiraceae bacterium]|nr:S-layer homology domain-containing protein [Oscillospiraceae bacterium]
MKQKRIALLLALILMLSTLTPAASAQRLDFADLDDRHWVTPFLQILDRLELDVFQGVPQNGGFHFQPNRNLTRAEFAAILVRAFDLHDETAQNPFEDVPDGAWYAPYVASATAFGMVHGINLAGTLFSPDADVTHQEAFVMFARVCKSLPFFDEPEKDAQEILSKFQDAEDLAPWAVEDVAFLVYHGFITGTAYGSDPNFPEDETIVMLYPLPHITRAETAALLARIADMIRVVEIMSRPPSVVIPDDPPPSFPEATMGALAERIREAEGYLNMQNRITTETFGALREMHRQAVGVYNAERFFQSVLNQTYYELVQAIENLVFLQKDDLWAAYVYASGYDHNVWHLYTPESFHAMQDARTYAGRIYHQTSITQADIDAALERLLATIDNLVRVQKDALSTALSDTRPDSQRWFMYTAESFGVFQRARSAASSVYTSMVPQDEVDEALETLLEAWDRLEQLPKEEFLLRIIRNGEVSEQLEDRFTPDSFVNLMPALNAARYVLQTSGTFDEHYAAASALAQAIGDLEIRARYQLPTFLAHGQLYVGNPRYTQESRDALRLVIDEARTMLDAPDTSDDELDDVLARLMATVLSLERV